MVNAPDKSFTVDDPKRGVRYVVWAYREISRREAMQFIRLYLAGLPVRKRPKRGDRVDIGTVLQ